VTASQGESASYSYDAAGRLASSAGFDGIATTYTHDAAGRLTGMSSVVASYFFTRDGNGRIVHTIETEPLSPSPVASSTAYSYNNAKNRLLSAGAVAYGYDDEGQLTSAGSASYSYDYEHRLAAIGSDARFEYNGASEIPLVDCLMSGYAMFSLKDPSLLAFDRRRTVEDHNLKTI
jgi:YD repeat-containing protein